MNKGNLAAAVRDWSNGKRMIVDATDFDKPVRYSRPQTRPMSDDEIVKIRTIRRKEDRAARHSVR